MKAIDLAGFEQKFSGDDDPWSTFSDRDEARKRSAILQGLGGGPIGRVLELAAGNGSNSVPLSRRALRLDATEGTTAGTKLVARAIGNITRVRVRRLVLPGSFPATCYDHIVVAEVLYYLSKRAMAQVARDIAAAVRPGGRLILAHHRVDYPDFVQHADGIHDRFVGETGVRWTPARGVRTGRWRVETYVRD